MAPKSLLISGAKNEPSGHGEVLLLKSQKDQQMWKHFPCTLPKFEGCKGATFSTISQIWAPSPAPLQTMIEKNKVMILCSICTLIFVSGGGGMPGLSHALVPAQESKRWSQRRGPAFDSCRLLDWHVHEAWVQYLMGAMARDYPAGYSSVRSEQIIKADRELWTILAQEHKETLRPSNDLPALNKGFTALTTDPRVTMYLLPVPVSATKGANASAPSKGTPTPKEHPSLELASTRNEN